MDPYEAYGEAAEQLTTPIIISGRNNFQAGDELHIINDILNKLHPLSSDRILEIGCGVGILLTPLSQHVAEAVGIDHTSCVARYKEFGVPSNVQLIAGRWPEEKPQGTFDRILVYSVLHYLPDAQTARHFIDNCISILKDGGGLMLGDIPNEDSRKRFLASDFGKRFEAEWVAGISRRGEEHAIRDRIFSQVENTPPYLTDDFILQLLADTRRQGLESYVVPQAKNLPFCYTREDILIWKRN
ncbi:MAG TPA: class I SAM-dependent methyltransferase [Candidatus Methanoperedens sp.]